MLSRLRRHFIPKDPLYRRESGAGRRVVLVSMDTSYQDPPPPGIIVFHLPDVQVTFGAGGWDDGVMT